MEEFEHHKRTALLHLLSDGAAFSTFFLMLGFMREARASLFSTIGRIFGGLSDTAKAFLIIASRAPCRGISGLASMQLLCLSLRARDGVQHLCASLQEMFKHIQPNSCRLFRVTGTSAY